MVKRIKTVTQSSGAFCDHQTVLSFVPFLTNLALQLYWEHTHIESVIFFFHPCARRKRRSSSGACRIANFGGENLGLRKSVLENGCNHVGILTFTIILEFFSSVYKIIYFIEFISELYTESAVLDKRKQTILQWTLYGVHYSNLMN